MERVRLEVDPVSASADRLFSLNKLEQAMDWAARLGGDRSSPRRPEILDEDAVQRNDEWALATWLVTKCRFLNSSPSEAAQPQHLVGELIGRVRARGKLPTLSEAEEILGALVTSVEAPGFDAVCRHPDTRLRLELVRDRWLEATPLGSTLGENGLLDARDIEALADLGSEAPRPAPNGPRRNRAQH